jgi:hypothetical protein
MIKNLSTFRKKYNFFQWGIIILSALAPILFLIEEVNKYIPVIVSILVTIFSAASKTFKFQEKWTEYRTTCESLRKEKHFYDFDLYEYGQAEDKETLFVQRVEALISRENTRWIEITNSSDKK